MYTTNFVNMYYRFHKNQREMNDENSTVQYSLIDHKMGNVAATV